MLDEPQTDSNRRLPEKEFRQRNALLTDLFEIPHFGAVQNMVFAIMLTFLLSNVSSDVVERGKLAITDDLKTVTWCFSKLFSALSCWFMMFLSTSLLVYLACIKWVSERKPVNEFTNFDRMFMTFYVVYQAAFLVLPAVFVFKYDLAPASTAIVCTEQIRFIMKSHAFVRANFESALLSGEARDREVVSRLCRLSEKADEIPPNSKTAPDGPVIAMSSGAPMPSFSHYLYFLFAPTLVYRWTYPRTPFVRWRLVIMDIFKILTCFTCSFFILKQFFFSKFADFGRSAQFSFSLNQIIDCILQCMLPGFAILIASFYGFLHCFLEAFAEFMRFGDRLFYKDWWNSLSLAGYFRTWNVVIHNWLYTYIYRDVYELSGRRGRFLALWMTYFLSALVHEYIFTMMFRFFYPVQFVTFGIFGFMVANIRGKSRHWNIVIWFELLLGMGILTCLYSIEWYARKNCPPAQSLAEFFIPRSWFCK